MSTWSQRMEMNCDSFQPFLIYVTLPTLKWIDCANYKFSTYLKCNFIAFESNKSSTSLCMRLFNAIINLFHQFKFKRSHNFAHRINCLNEVCKRTEVCLSQQCALCKPLTDENWKAMMGFHLLLLSIFSLKLFNLH